MNNGTRKGGWPVVMKTLFSSPGLEDVWQMHFSLLGGQEYTVPGMFIANGVDDQPAALPIAPAPLPAGRQCSSATGARRSGVLDQGVRQRRRDVHRHKRAKRLFKNICAPIARAPLIYAPPGCC